jgi:rsbT co-antagonist protein RsbR
MRRFWQWLMRIDSLDDDIRQRGAMLALLAVFLICFAILTIPFALLSTQPTLTMISEVGGILFYSLVLFLARRGLVSVGGFLIISVLLLGILAPLIRASEAATTGFFLVLPVVVGGLVLRPVQIWLVLAIIVLGLGAIVSANPSLQTQTSLTSLAGVGALLGIITLLSFIGARAMARALADARLARRNAERAAEHLAQVNSELEQRVDERTHDLQIAVEAGEIREARLLAALNQNEQQANTIRDMSVPVIPISDTMLIMPLIGALDSTRLELIKEQALQAIQALHSRILILDITGVPIIDTQVAQGILTVMQATRLLGAEVVLVGVRPEVAQTIVGLGITLEGLRTARDLQSLLQHVALN